MKILFDADDHPPPHFHALFAEYEAKVRLEALGLEKGSLPRAKMKSVLDWASTRQPQLRAAWLTAQAKRKPGRIE